MPNTIFYYLFTIIVLILFYTIPSKYRPQLLLISSLFFYGWLEKFFLIVLILVISLSYFMARYLDSFPSNPEKRKKILYLYFFLLAPCFLPFKYAHFFQSSNLWFLYLPMGLSFFTFQAISYVLDVYYQKIDSQKNPLTLALYISFFPQLVCGPIERSSNIIPQLQNHKMNLNDKNLSKSFLLITTGLYKKMLLANSLFFMMMAYKFPLELTGPEWILIAFMTRVLIYFDFSGYTDIVRGTSFLFGIELVKNFHYPFSAQSIDEFWRRWHISLSSWIKDYLFYPLALTFTGPYRLYLSLIVSFCFLGIWHGADLHFLVYGLINGMGVVLHILFFKNYFKSSFGRLFYQIFTMIFLISIPAILLKIDHLSTFGLIIKKILFIHQWEIHSILGQQILEQSLSALIFFVPYALFEYFNRSDSIERYLSGLSIIPKTCLFFIVLSLLISIILVGHQSIGGVNFHFIYQDF